MTAPARPLNLFLPEANPAFAMADADATWDFGTAAQGTLLKRSFTFANTGALDLLTYVSAPAGLTVSQTGSRRVGMADMTTYEMALNTANLTVGPYDGTITIRTSDPDSRERTVHVVGTVTAAPADTPVGAMQRPLDGPRRFRHQGAVGGLHAHAGARAADFAPGQSVQPRLRALGRVSGNMQRRSEQGTASYDMFGDGRDGVMPSSGNLDYDKGVGLVSSIAGAPGLIMSRRRHVWGLARSTWRRCVDSPDTGYWCWLLGD